jgi:TENA/THI-4/PQQC family
VAALTTFREAFARALGLSETNLQAYEPLPEAHAYTAYTAWLALDGSWPRLLRRQRSWTGENCGWLSRALHERCGLYEPDVAFFDLFASPVAGFAENVLTVIKHGLTQGVDPRRVRRAARLLQSHELLYWDTFH